MDWGENTLRQRWSDVRLAEALDACRRELADAQARNTRLEEALEMIGCEVERIKDVRVNRTKVIGNVHLIAQEALAEGTAGGENA